MRRARSEGGINGRSMRHAEHFAKSVHITLVGLGIWAVVVAAAFGAAWALSRVRSVRALVAENEAGRLQSLDGLRAVLAISVMVHHGYLMHALFSDGSWYPPKNTFNEVLGRGAVAMFFMITAFLFWSRALAVRGRMDAGRLYRSRFRRVGPGFLATIAVTVLVVLALQKFRIVVPPAAFAMSLVRHVALGFSIFTPIDGLTMPHVLDGPTWSLGYEMLFYLALPVLALVVRLRRPWIAPVVVFLVASKLNAFSAVSFIPGIVAAEIAARPRYAAWFARNGSKILLGGLAVFVVGVFAEPNYALIRKPQLLVLAVIFLGIVFTPKISVLRLRPLLLLGTISYSFYLFHSTVLYLVLEVLDVTVVRVGSLPTLAYWSIVTGSAMLAVLVSLASYRVLEEPFMRSARVRPAPAIVTDSTVVGAVA